MLEQPDTWKPLNSTAISLYGIENADDIDPADVVPGYMEAATWVLNIANEKLKKLPKNAEAEAGEEK